MQACAPDTGVVVEEPHFTEATGVVEFSFTDSSPGLPAGLATWVTVMLPDEACAASDPPIETMPAARRAAPVRHDSPCDFSPVCP
jgi:hypothetical protein